MPLITLSKVDSFERVRSLSQRKLHESVISTVKKLDEVDEIEPWIQSKRYKPYAAWPV